ncbi:Nucleotide-binding universal stress protein, UspA family [Fodinibius roseus]|uniref:Nucleotide-binding universal stress protein, UspA family n=1 Tax=Fodinibius roseus TaxID=1194090 RepID=A0A1M4XBB1_9BACT|nr:universal stress protein [Fodinibius roseus]SHE90690.1 Nucleotide-binding universal stress protein, UspA family [Fodinibius roseus]
MDATINNILFPTDFSDNARHALPFALKIAKRIGATVHILHAIEEPYDFAPMDEEIKEGVTKKVRRLFDKIIREIEKEGIYSDIPVETHIRTGRAINAILETDQSFGADLIVMGTKGRSGLKRIFIGSTTADVVEASAIPVLAIPENAPITDFNQILFTTDYHDGDLKALQYVVELAKRYKARIKVFHTTLESNLKTECMFYGFRELVKEKISYEPIDFEEEKSITFFEGVANQIERYPISLVVMIRYVKPLSLIGPKKQSRDMSYYIQAPLLVLPGKTNNN